MSISPRVLFWLFAVVLLVTVYGGGAIVGLLVDHLWFGAIGFPQVFRTMLWSRIGLGVGATAIVFVLLLPNFLFAVRQLGDPRRFLPPEALNSPLKDFASRRGLRWLAIAASAVAALLAGIGLAVNWEQVLLYLHAQPFGHTDPIFGLDASFYVFSLPFYALLRSFLWSAAVAATIGTAAVYYIYFQAERARERR